MDANEEIVALIKGYQERLDKYVAKNNEEKILYYLNKLKKLPIKTVHLETTGVGRSVNALKKLGGTVGNAAKEVVASWKMMVLAEEQATKDAEENAEDEADSAVDSDSGNSEDDLNIDINLNIDVDDDVDVNIDVSSSHSVHSETEPEEQPMPKPSGSKDDDRRDKLSKDKHHSGSHSKKKRKRKDSESEDRKSKKHKSHRKHHSSDSDREESHQKRRHDSESSEEEKRQKRRNDSESEEDKRHKSRKSRYRSDSTESKPKKNESSSSKSKDKTARHDHERSDSNSKSKSDKKKDEKAKSHKSRSHSSSDKDKSDDKKRDKHKEDSSRSKRHSKENERQSKSSKSSSSSSSKRSSEKKTKDKTDGVKVIKVNNEKMINGIDSGSGASFAEALGMCGPLVTPKNKKKSSPPLTAEKPQGMPSSSRAHGLEVPDLLQEPELEPLNLNIDNFLPEITPNYKPLGLPLDMTPKKLMTDDEALSRVMSNRNQKTKVYSGNKVRGKVESLFQICVRVLQDNIDALEYTGGVPFSILKPIIDRANPDQLFNLEHHNPYLMDDTNELWQLHCQKEFRTKQREEMESWREMYMRCLEEREARLSAITATIKQSQDKSLPVRTTKLAYVDSVAKPPRNIARRQVKNGIPNVEKQPKTASKLAALAIAGDAGKVAVPNPGSRAMDRSSGGSSSASIKPKKAPLMAKTLSFLKNRFRR